MLIFNENNDIEDIDDISPIDLKSNYYWILDLSIRDFVITPLIIFEQWIGPVFTVSVNNFKFKIPTVWYMLIQGDETMQLDIINAEELLGKSFQSVVYGPNMSNIQNHPVIIEDYENEGIMFTPSLSRHQMLCHPISKHEWINVAPSDGYNKYIDGTVIGDLM